MYIIYLFLALALACTPKENPVPSKENAQTTSPDPSAEEPASVDPVSEDPVSEDPDSRDPEAPEEKQPEPTMVEIICVNSRLILSWTDNSRSETGYLIYTKDEEDSEYRLVESLGPDVESYEVSIDPDEKRTYWYGVRTDTETVSLRSDIVWVSFTVVPPEEPKDDMISITSTYADNAGLAFTYSFDVPEINSTPSAVHYYNYGLCWKEGSGLPTVGDEMIYGPIIKPSAEAWDRYTDGRIKCGEDIYHAIPAPYLKHGCKYQVRAFIYRNRSGEVHYSNPVEISLEDDPDPIVLEWTKLSRESLPDGIELYSSTSKVNGRGLNSWYAVADLEKVSFKVNVPSSLTQLDAQMSSLSDCYVLINGGYFDSKDIGVYVREGEVGGVVSNSTINWHSYFTARGIIGVSDGKPGIKWTGNNWSVSYWSDMPIPFVAGEAQYPQWYYSYDGDPNTYLENTDYCFFYPFADWEPEWGLSGGPVLLYDGNVCVNHVKTPRGNFYRNNFELMAYDIFDQVCDRTAVGILEDGRMVFYICDGRITGSQGLNLDELALVMKGIGCIYALNFDGGGSTGMALKGEHIGDYSSRSIASTLGFFKK